MIMLKFRLQGIDTDLEIELKRSKEYYDWRNEGKPKDLQTEIIFCNDIDACPVGTVEWINEILGNQKPLVPPKEWVWNKNIYGTRGGIFTGSRVPVDIDSKWVYLKSATIIKSEENGWYRPGQEVKEDTYVWREQFPSPILGEFRVFLGRDGQILDIRNYEGYTVWPDIHEVIEKADLIFNHYKRAITFDVVVLETGTHLLEVHDYFALGLYGFNNRARLPFLVWDWWCYGSRIHK